MKRPAAVRLGAELADPGARARAIAELGSALVSARGNVTRAAVVLGVSRRALLVWIARERELGGLLTRTRERRAG